MAVFYSDQYQDLAIDSPPTRVDADIAFGQVQLLRFTYTQAALGSIGDVVYLRHVPPQCQIIMPLSYFKFTAWDTNTIIDIGHLAYKTPAGATVAAAAAALLNDLDADAAGWWFGGTTMTSTSTMAHNAPVVDVFQIRAQAPVVITATFPTVAPTAADTLSGWLAVTIL